MASGQIGDFWNRKPLRNASRTLNKQRDISSATSLFAPLEPLTLCSLQLPVYVPPRDHFADDRKQRLQPCLHHRVGLMAEAPRAVDRHLLPGQEVVAQGKVIHLVNSEDVEAGEEVLRPPRIQKPKVFYKDCKRET